MTSFNRAMFKLKRLALLLVVCGILSSATEATTRNILVEISTSKGRIFAELYPQKAPLSVANFLAYVDEGFYTNTIFHRVYKDFVIQGGGYTPSLIEKTTTRNAIQNEAANGLSNTRGTLAMARLNDPNSATNQFFINTRDNSRALDHKGSSYSQFGYAVFGKMIHGWDVLDAIENTPVKQVQFFEHLPEDTVVIHAIKRLSPQ